MRREPALETTPKDFAEPEPGGFSPCRRDTRDAVIPEGYWAGFATAMMICSPCIAVTVSLFWSAL